MEKLLAFAFSLALLTHGHGKPASVQEEAVLKELLKALVQEEALAEVLDKAEITTERAVVQNEFSLIVVGCDELTSGSRSSLSNYLKQFIIGNVTLSCSGSKTAEASGGGVTYTRWGHNACPSEAAAGTQLIYSGRLAGAFYNQKGGGANYMCLPDDPENGDLITTNSKKFSRIYGAEYEHPIVGLHNHGVPCAVCYDSARSAELMIPAKTTCPAGWFREYYGYVMSEGNWNDRSRNQYICVDKDQASLPNTSGNQNGPLLYHVRATCHGIQCPPYNTKALTCVVCSK